MQIQYRDPVSGLTHLAAAIFSLAGLVLLIFLARSTPDRILPLIIYGLSLIAMFSASAVYHLVRTSPENQLWLRKMDHSAIYLLIAGTYTPVCLTFFTGFYRWGLLAIVWLFALTGITVKLCVIHAPRWLNAGIYLVMGWLAVFAMGQIITRMPLAAILWLAAGGFFFTLGAVIYITRKMDFWPGVFGFHEIWHIFVILGCLCHFIMIACYIAPGNLIL
ncbi:MAG: hemolysin III family protein [Leptolinea sp.]|jgi:hemolysin III|nr:hemolysin III family protein [Leptolinea sp.]